MLKGLDFAYGSGVTTTQIKGHGFHFVCRYLSHTASKNISKAEFHNYLAAGIQVVFVFEDSGVDMTSSANGVADALTAQAQLNELGAPTAVVFFAADEQAEPDEVGYLHGAVSVLGKKRVGIYGGLGSVRAAFNNNVVSYGWQTYAWSSGEWDDRALLRQTLNGITVGPCTGDLDYAAYWNSTKVLSATDDYGQWPRPVVAPPKPKPKPVGPVAEPVLKLGDKGSAVKLLQSLLNAKPVLVTDGIFGSATEAAVKAFQKSKKITVDGVVGPVTWSKLGNYS